jgi:hypothetical protein
MHFALRVFLCGLEQMGAFSKKAKLVREETKGVVGLFSTADLIPPLWSL